MKQHLVKLASRFAEHHMMKAKRAKDDGDEEMKQEHTEMAEECAQFGKLLSASMKAADMSDGDELVPLPAGIRTIHSGVPSSVTLITRAGGAPVQKTAVSPQFQSLVAIDEEE